MKIAVVGSGVSGLTAAHLLSQKHDVEVLEKASTIGGHTATVDVTLAGKSYAVDTGFIVFNNKTYPLFRNLMRSLQVTWQDTEMSFSVTNPDSGLEYNGHNLNTLFAQRRNLLSPNFYRFISEILKFNKAAKEQANLPSEALDKVTLKQFMDELSLSQSFQHNYLKPMCAAIWSASLKDVEDFPLGFFLRFFENHGLLDIKDRPQWHVIKGGSRTYLKPLCKRFENNIKVNTEIASIERRAQDVLITLASGEQRVYDHVVFACHSNQALSLLKDATEDEKRVLDGIPYQANEVVLHTDTRLLPRKQRAWASWNYLLPSVKANESEALTMPTTLTYNMNILQGIEAKDTFCVTLNSTSKIDPTKILRSFVYDHPVYSVESFAARKERGAICGVNRTHFCGAYWYNGFHEDGVRSANDLCERFDVDPIVPSPQDGIAHV
ncbi:MULTISPECIES: NAD(P)/FAD-dependent oxidoreductase [Gammaproteobacteria]|uniref:NAD(P)/FAD-dependent oxidoreductase n=1 Tax=Gammaproteobacteria TaxID=1236 RepID=UPI000DD03A81|nr:MULTISPECIES: FAD-dependent oxidoreductase [Gammaproteobacteria]RTE87320.1 FAD-dependent oxidoreductase [Aliidiomarina sp. B3213]TCZ92894.1 FAD-dependent oxidoreductase [Lysobacter sp. N42]